MTGGAAGDTDHHTDHHADRRHHREHRRPPPLIHDLLHPESASPRLDAGPRQHVPPPLPVPAFLGTSTSMLLSFVAVLAGLRAVAHIAIPPHPPAVPTWREPTPG